MSKLNAKIQNNIKNTHYNGSVRLGQSVFIAFRKLAAILAFFLAIPSTHAQQAYIKQEYCIVDDKNNQMYLRFKTEGDTVYLLYSNIVNEGNIVNDYADTADYAGYFTMADVQDSSVNMNIKSYKAKDQTFTVSLKFREYGKKLSWFINTQLEAYLPKIAIFQECVDSSTTDAR